MDRKVFYNGTILTMQAEGHTVEAVYTIGDRIAAIGNRDDVFRQITDDTERVDLEGKTLIPGFIESHAHVTDWAECEFLQFTCYHIKNIAELQDMIRENAKTKKAGEWVIGYGYNDSMVAEMRHLERADIDAACADHPVFVMHGSGHLAYVNSKALEICNIHADTPIPAGGQGEIHLGADGLPSGLLIGAILSASRVEGMNLPLSMALIVWRLTPTCSANCCWVRRTTARWTRMLFFMVQVAVQSVKIEVIDEQEDDQRSGHAAGHYRKVVDVVL